MHPNVWELLLYSIEASYNKNIGGIANKDRA